MKSKHSFRLIILTFIVIAMSSQSFAASTKLVGTHKTNDAVILEYNDKGVHVTVYNDPKNANKRQIELIEKKQF